ncbi:2Fe-2S iron-sulfur cluster binding domain-containing protein [Paraburkholderia fungorum]|uniref:2Fe-2S iron-sulfur cluster binding domain-containing protein n=1 Tax=Paraburkholderia fungorum TaxID=134537 RepID=A0A1H1JQI6_9BURK|nr:(2Fe-2S)-binding protein [Paraburkholderia fungorum]SDR52276.1 2Fe-2S iron-sulfur cluster binding domain-containing protein [Paraburkholderia fungorum]
MRIHDPHRTAAVELFLDGRRYCAHPGESVAAALFAAGVKTLRVSPRLNQPRGMYCLMGSCQECLVMVNGSRVLACQTSVVNGMRIETVPETGIDV